MLLFDGVSGEWLARVAEVGKRRMTLSVERRVRDVEAVPDLWLAFAPVKRGPLEFLVEKATELGIARLLPVVTKRTVVERVKLERLQAIAIEAAEQCGRTLVPEIAEPLALEKMLAERDSARTLYFADETGGEPIVNRRKRMSDVPATNVVSDTLSKDLKKRGFRFVGSTIIYAYLQAAGLVDDHTDDCFIRACR